MKILEATSKDSATVVRFEWRMNEWGSTHDHRIIVRAPQIEDEFRFGGCARSGLRKVHRFFGDHYISECGLGFQNPQIQTYDLRRNDSGAISLTVEDAARLDPLHLELGCDIAVRDWKEDEASFEEEKDTQNKPWMATPTSRSVSMIFRNFNTNSVIDVRRR